MKHILSLFLLFFTLNACQKANRKLAADDVAIENTSDPVFNTVTPDSKDPVFKNTQSDLKKSSSLLDESVKQDEPTQNTQKISYKRKLKKYQVKIIKISGLSYEEVLELEQKSKKPQDQDKKSQDQLAPALDQKDKKPQDQDLIQNQASKSSLQASLKADSSSKTADQAKARLDVLFFTDGKESRCTHNFADSVKNQGFLDHLSTKWAWQASLSSYAGNIASLTSLNASKHKPAHKKQTSSSSIRPSYYRYINDFVISEKEYAKPTRDQMFVQGLKSNKYLMHHDESVTTKSHFNGYMRDPLFALHNLLIKNPKNLSRQNTQMLVVFFDHQFAYYSKQEWQAFLKIHKNIHIIAVSSRDGNISNILHIANQSERIKILTTCSSLALIKNMQNL